MTLPPTIKQSGPNLEDRLRRYELAWRDGQRPELGAFVSSEGEVPADQLLELALVDLELRARWGDVPRVEDYLTRFPGLADTGPTLQLIQSEMQVRARFQHAPTVEEYIERFPQLSPQIRAFVVDRQLDADAQTVGDNRPGQPILQRPMIPGLTILAEVGRGGMGAVYRAHEKALDRVVAIKTLIKFPDADSASRFKREAETIARLAHPNIIGIHGIGTWQARGTAIPYFTMPFYPGGSLDRQACGPGSDWRQHVRWLIQVCQAVQHAHERGVLHRDLKPSNILLDDNQSPQVADFGLAGWFASDQPHEFTSDIVGTPSFMAPEQARDPRAITTAVDVYGLGSILYYQLTASPPFVGDSPLAIMRQVESEPPLPPSQRSPGVPRDLEIICLKCLEKEPRHRYASAGMIAADLTAWLEGRPISARPATRLERFTRLVRRHPYVTGLASATVLALVFAVVVLLVANQQVREQEAQTRNALNDLDASYRQQQRVLYVEQVAASARLYNSNSLQHAWALLDQCSEAHRDWEWHYLNRLRQSPGIVLSGHERGSLAVNLLADGRPITIDGSGTLRVWSAEGALQTTRQFPTQGHVRLTTHPGRPMFAVIDSRSARLVSVGESIEISDLPGSNWGEIHPDGRTFLVAQGSDVVRIDLSTRAELGRRIALGAAIVAGTISHDGAKLFVADRTNQIHRWDLTNHRPIGPSWERPVPVSDLALTRDDRTLMECLPSQLRVTDASNGNRRRTIDDAPGRPMVTAGPDAGTFLAPTTLNDVVLRRTVEGSPPIRHYRGHTGYITSLAISRNGSQLLTGGSDGSARLFDATRTAEYDEITLDDPVRPGAFRDGPFLFRLSPDGKRAVLVPRAVAARVDGQLTLVDLEHHTLLAPVVGSSDAAFLPDGRSLVVIGRSPALSIWDLEQGRTVAAIELAEPPVRLAVEPNGQRVAVADVRGKVRLFHLPGMREEPTRITTSGSIYALDWADHLLAISGRDSVDVVNVDHGKLVTRLKVPSSARKAAIDLANRRFAVAASNRPFSLHGLDDAREQPMIGAPGEINDLAFHPSGRRLATAGADGRARVWDCESGRELLDFPSGHRAAMGVAWSPDGERLYGLGRAIRIWAAR